MTAYVLHARRSTPVGVDKRRENSENDSTRPKKPLTPCPFPIPLLIRCPLPPPASRHMPTISQILAIALEHQQAGRLQVAAEIYRQILQVQPDQVNAIHLLGVIAHRMGKPDEAIACYRRTVELKPDFAEAHYNLGNVLRQQAKLDEALACYRRTLELKPDFAEAHYNLGVALGDQGTPDEAVAHWRRALELKPDYAPAHVNLGLALKEQGKLDEALACYRRALELNPDLAEVYIDLGIAFQDQGKLDEAIECFRKAAACCRRIVQSRPQSAEPHNILGKALGQLALSLGIRLPEDDVATMRQLLSEENVRGESRIAVEFGLARVLDATGNYGQAAEHLRQANALRGADLRTRNREYKPAEYRAFVERLIATSTSQLFARSSGFGLETELPVFIFGLPRSGTTLAEQILASHRQVFGAGEVDYCEETFQSLPKTVQRHETPLKCLRDIDRNAALSLAQRHLERLQAHCGSAFRIVDKMPDNYHFLGLISILFPRARLIHCRRDLRDTALSCWMTNFAGRLDLPSGRHSVPLRRVSALAGPLAERAALAMAERGLRGDGRGHRGRCPPHGRVVRAGVGSGMPEVPRDAAAGADRQRGAGPPADLQELGGPLEKL